MEITCIPTYIQVPLYGTLHSEWTNDWASFRQAVRSKAKLAPKLELLPQILAAKIATGSMLVVFALVRRSCYIYLSSVVLGHLA